MINKLAKKIQLHFLSRIFDILSIYSTKIYLLILIAFMRVQLINERRWLEIGIKISTG